MGGLGVFRTLCYYGYLKFLLLVNWCGRTRTPLLKSMEEIIRTKKQQNSCLIQKLFISLPRYCGLLQIVVNYCKYTIFI